MNTIKSQTTPNIYYSKHFISIYHPLSVPTYGCDPREHVCFLWKIMTFQLTGQPVGQSAHAPSRTGGQLNYLPTLVQCFIAIDSWIIYEIYFERFLRSAVDDLFAYVPTIATIPKRGWWRWWENANLHQLKWIQVRTTFSSESVCIKFSLCGNGKFIFTSFDWIMLMQHKGIKGEL